MLEIFRFSCLLKACLNTALYKKVRPTENRTTYQILQEYFIKDLISHNTRNKGKILKKGLTITKKTLTPCILGQPHLPLLLIGRPVNPVKPVEHLLFGKVHFFAHERNFDNVTNSTNNLGFARVLVERK